MDCLFCEAAAGRVEVEVVFEDDEVFAFLDHRPLFPGHLLVIPRRHAPTLADLRPDEVGPYFTQVQRLTRAVEVGTDARGSFVALNNRISQSVPHLHVHIVPRNPGDGLRGFFWPRHRYPNPAEAAETAARIRGAL